MSAQVWGSLIIFIACPLLGGLPLIEWLTLTTNRGRLSSVGTGNISVSAAFYHGGTLLGILAVVSEAAKGIGAVLLARYFFPDIPAWELIALIAVVVGRYWWGKGAGATNVVWGIVVHDPIAAGLIAFIGGVSFTIIRDRVWGRTSLLVLLPLILSLRHPSQGDRIVASIILSLLLGWIYSQMRDDLNLPTPTRPGSDKMFRFFQGHSSLLSLDDRLLPREVGQKAATLSQLKRWGYSVPQGWVLRAGDDPIPLIESLEPSEANPLIARSSATGEDSETSSAAGQYQSVSDITSKRALQDGILRCQASYHGSFAAQYRRDRGSDEGAGTLSVLVQQQIQGAFSGVAFSRDPILCSGDGVLVEGLPGTATAVVSGRTTPEQYRVILPLEADGTGSDEDIPIEGEGNLPPALVRQVAKLARDIEQRYHGIPQDIEWTYDGQQLWLLQSRPITTLLPLWTRKIAAEVIPGAICPLTWSINRPLTCGVWGEIFTIVLGNERVEDLDFNETATLHYNHAYFNATLLGAIFRRMGLPEESLEFLLRGAKFSRPPLSSTLRNLPGLLRLLLRELNLQRDFIECDRHHFSPLLTRLAADSPDPAGEEKDYSATQILAGIDEIVAALEQATYFNILAPLSFALRQGIFRVEDSQLDNRCLPEVASMRSLAELAADARNILPLGESDYSSPAVFALLAETPDGEGVLDQIDRWLERYGYLSEAATDIAAPRWRENPRHVRELFASYLQGSSPESEATSNSDRRPGLRTAVVQRRLELKARVARVYNRLLAHLRWHFVALERLWIEGEWLNEAGDIFFLRLAEIRKLVAGDEPKLRESLGEAIAHRRQVLKGHRQMSNLPFVVYGQPPDPEVLVATAPVGSPRLQGIGASAGEAIGRVKRLAQLGNVGEINRETILVVPYTDAGWAPLLSRAGGIIAEVGGRLSHGAIIAREYKIPAVMDVRNAMQSLQDGQQVRIDGTRGTVEILASD